MLRTVRPADASSLWDVRLAWHEKVVLFVLRQGVLPRHVAVVADGSRRYAKTAGMKLGEAYDILFQNLVSFCFWMERLGVTHLSSFILSCRNFRRATCELDAALDKLLYFFTTTLNSLFTLSGNRFTPVHFFKRLYETGYIVVQMNLRKPFLQVGAAAVMFNE
ncbi:hypothetical protein V5799_004616 [Amblyomma americanum]|uniref:ditrans,polycis-polyprenyl diphosphate synthase [(2E,6E)-farnesyldiphosphate specific] n=1 Tax=Amblyomma americanum TaxID=6943 RepID=A0AAQ4D5L1_AMBAM